MGFATCSTRTMGTPACVFSRIAPTARRETSPPNASPALLALRGVDVGDPRIWQQSLDELQRLCELAW